MIWIIGEYADRIDNADELLEQFLDTFEDETPQVQLALLTAIVKLFLKKPKDTQDMVQKVLNFATQETDNPDLRDRGFIYWRLLATDPAAAKAVVLSDKPLITDDSSMLEPSLLNELLHHISTLASVYHKPPSSFVSKLKGLRKKTYIPRADDDDAEEEEQPEAVKQQAGTLIDLGSLGAALPTTNAPTQGAAQSQSNPTDISFLQNSSIGKSVSSTVSSPAKVILPASQGKGVEIKSSWSRVQGQVACTLVFSNQGQSTLSGFAIQFNKNSLGLAPPDNALASVPPLMPGISHSITFPVQPGVAALLNSAQPFSTLLQIAVKVGADILYFQDSVPFFVFLSEDGQLPKAEYLQVWGNIPDKNERNKQINVQTNSELIKQKLSIANIFFIAQRRLDNVDVLYFSSKSVTGQVILIEITFELGAPLQLCTRTETLDTVSAFEESVEMLIQL